MARVTKDLEEKLGTDKVEEIADKDWKVAELPTEEELAKEEHKSPKARSNPKSRANLAQYNKKNKKQKKAALKNLKIEEVEEDIDPKDVLGDSPSIAIIESIMPARKVLRDRAEQEVYYNTITLFLKDFNIEELSFSDIDDIVTLALNNIVIQRLYAIGAKNTVKVLEAGPTIEKLRKQSDKIKSNLASRRVDRIDLKNKPALSIVELAAHLDEQEKLDFDARIKEMEKAEKEYEPPKRGADGFLESNDA